MAGVSAASNPDIQARIERTERLFQELGTPIRGEPLALLAKLNHLDRAQSRRRC